MTREECIQKIRHIQKSMYTFIFEDGLSHKFKADDADKFYYYLDMIVKYLDEDVPKTGHWIIEKWNNKEHYSCSSCQHVVDYEPCYHYCPYCGAKMVELQESEVKE